jgi:exopolysaccharide biosynthesis WecB/TagA/CpsF family protein
VEFEFGGETIRITHPDRAALIEAVAARLAAGEGFALATLNLDHMVKLGASAAFRAAYRAHDFIVADGNPVVWLSRLAGRPVRLVAGSDLVIPLAQVAAGAGVPVALVGSTGEALDGAAAALGRVVPGLGVTLLHAPEMNFDPDGEAGRAVLAEIADSGAGLVLLALGAVRQEGLAARGRALLPNVGFVSVGAGLDFLGGRQRRAPWLLRRLALEWLWRALGNPLRLGPRYLRSAMILPGQIRAAWRMGRARAR